SRWPCSLIRAGAMNSPKSSSTAIMITSSNSPGLGSGMPHHYVGDLRHSLAISGLSHVRTELPHLLVIPLLPPHPIESNREFPRHGYLGNPSLSSHGQVEKMASPVRITADRHL